MIRLLRLERTNPDPGQASGYVADAVVFGDGTSVLKWRTEPGSIEIYSSEAEMRSVRESSGRSRFIS